MAEKIFSVSKENPNMLAAFTKARETFKYFWRELYWEYHRIIPALDVACVKVTFTQEVKNDTVPLIEYMWVNEINFDGEKITGILINEPTELTNIHKGAHVEISLHQLSDWLFAISGKTYGGFTIQAIRSEMNKKERAAHDKAWGLDFGDHNDILLVYEHKEHPENLVEHPMSKNMKEKLIEFINQYPGELQAKDEAGNTLLHKEVIAGNLTSVEVIKTAGVPLTEKNNYGKTALDYARQLNWEHIIPVLEN